MGLTRPTTILPDGTPLYPAEWSPPADKPADKPRGADAWVRAHKPQQARFPGGGQGAREGTTVPTATTQRQGSEGAQRTLDGVVEWAGGSPKAPPPRVPESAKLPAIPAPVVTANEPTPRNVGQYSPTPPNDDETSQRTTRFIRLAMARKVLRGTQTATCMMYARGSDGVQVVQYAGCAGYRGWEHCGSRLCPWCCAKLAQKDTSKAERFIKGWVKRKNAIALCHYTLRHSADELPQDVWDAQTKVLDSTHHGRPWDRFRQEYGLLEHIYGNEVTDGANGCHKHQHRVWELQMCPELHGRTERRRFGRRMEDAYKALYMAALAKHGRSALPQYALKVSIAAPTQSNARRAAEYVTKFAKETQQGGLKSGNQGNRTVFELLDLAGDNSASTHERLRARDRYADLYYGLKGKHWSYFSEATTGDDTEAGGEPEVPETDLDDDGDVLITLSAREAAMLSDQHMQVDLLERVEQQGVKAAKAWLADFSDPARWSKEFLDRFR